MASATSHHKSATVAGLPRMRAVYTASAMSSSQTSKPPLVMNTLRGFKEGCLVQVSSGVRWHDVFLAGAAVLACRPADADMIASTYYASDFTVPLVIKARQDDACARVASAHQQQPSRAATTQHPAYHPREKLHELKARALWERGEDVPTPDAIEFAEELLGIAERRIRDRALSLCTVVGPWPERGAHLQWTDRRRSPWLHFEIICPARPVDDFTTLRTVETPEGHTLAQQELTGVSLGEVILALEQFMADVQASSRLA